MGKYIRGLVNEELALGTLAATTIITAPFDDAVNERALISSIVASYSITDLSPGTGIGPIMVGVAHSDYTAAEIEAFLENATTWEETDQIGQEISKRKVRIVGILGQGGSASSTDVASLNDGKPIKTKLNWILTVGQTLQLWAYNLGSAAVATTDPLVSCVGHANIFPR